MCKLTDYTDLAEYTWKTLLCLFYNITVAHMPHHHLSMEKKYKWHVMSMLLLEDLDSKTSVQRHLSSLKQLAECF